MLWVSEHGRITKGQRSSVAENGDLKLVGEDFESVIDDTISKSHVVISVIGSHWLQATDDSGQPRLDDPNDIVRIEIEMALNRNVRLIPVLVDEATMPKKHELPDTLRPLAHRNPN